VEDGSPAERAGIQEGDLVAAAAGRELDGIEGLYASLDALPREGGTLELTVVRGTEDRRVEVDLTEQPA
ncbi:MAG: PDZ domain-containing protein, partial [Actinomycetota bacterium]|nr:PDZ domain-containing protein [Actinomycetota bacterium]